MPRELHDIAIIGSGVIGLAPRIALLQEQPSLKLVKADKENEIL
jgi:glycine/D-amino acid oxidase-like deaminating enzyme